MVSFQGKLAGGLRARGVDVCFDLADTPYQAVLVIGGTRQIGGLWRAHRCGVPIVQRLDGMNWMHRLQPTGLRHYLRAEYGNGLLALIRSHLADRIVYQSEFSHAWWERIRGPVAAQACVIYNGVDLGTYTPEGPHQRPSDHPCLLLVEGSLMGGYEVGLEAAVQLASQLAIRLRNSHSQTFEGFARVELRVVGKTASDLRHHWERRITQEGLDSNLNIQWTGLVTPEQIPEIDRSAHLLYSADVNAACPNSVIEALGCGLPVAAYDTGSLPELIQGKAGRIVPYGGDPWRLEPPDIPSLAEAAVEILENQGLFRQNARSRAEAAFGLDEMVDAYLQVLLES
jgi:glycosyltransferase involved in cell wall biosynthesis